ncbi:ANTAR domain-containing response regulator [Paenibacillus chartarius]|uniref:ANTAR domain-containing response regulator n=1 Tax=Paenibacillus chartarius TaxID=747481 RepID=A0ABV6DJ52_9BACL
MLQTFLLVEEVAGFRSEDGKVPENKLRDMGLRVLRAASDSRELKRQLDGADAALLCVPVDALSSWRKKLLAQRYLPIFFWCDSATFPSHECKLDLELDGLLSAGMSEMDVHAALLLGFQHFIQRRDWVQEREQLLSRLEERKWIDQAKGILSEIKGISEAEAYDFLRKQAMNERKRMVDVATSIVKVYQLLQDQNKGGRRT